MDVIITAADIDPEADRWQSANYRAHSNHYPSVAENTW